LPPARLPRPLVKQVTYGLWESGASAKGRLPKERKHMTAAGSAATAGDARTFGMKMIRLKPIGIIHSPFRELRGMPIQPAGALGVKGSIEVFEEYRAGLKDLDGFSHVILLYHFHRSQGFDLHVVPFMDSRPRGLFATRAPRRPNPIGLSVVQLERIEGGVLHIRNVDILDGTPLWDIKPYVPEFDIQQKVRTGWLETARKTVSDRKSDDRFTSGS
jgi:tRNA-Thr(GGU) m(6)t(6)A37 methyltransferase TsaA